MDFPRFVEWLFLCMPFFGRYNSFDRLWRYNRLSATLTRHQIFFLVCNNTCHTTIFCQLRTQWLNLLYSHGHSDWSPFLCSLTRSLLALLLTSHLIPMQSFTKNNLIIYCMRLIDFFVQLITTSDLQADHLIKALESICCLRQVGAVYFFHTVQITVLDR